MTIGVSAARIDGVEKVTGAAKFTGDIAIPGLLDYNNRQIALYETHAGETGFRIINGFPCLSSIDDRHTVGRCRGSPELRRLAATRARADARCPPRQAGSSESGTAGVASTWNPPSASTAQ